ncbi:MAG: thiol:disulfide interchange protein [Acidobacteria bacterium]|nr:thiol:disulfide interchange protein [Acidobacteriota bacterium]
MTLEALLAQFGPDLSGGFLLATGIALAGGVVASAVCPCTLPVGLGMAGLVGAYESDSHRRGLPIAAGFFGGIVVNLMLLGLLAARLGAVLTESFGRYWALGMAAVSLMAAVVAFYGPRLRADALAALRKPGILAAFGYGFIFSLGTSAAPLLVLLTVAAGQANPANGLLLAMAFGIGRGLPFLLVAVFAGLLVRFTRIGQWRPVIQLTSGTALLVVSGYYMWAFFALL